MVTLLKIGAFMQFNSYVLYKHLQLERENFGDIWEKKCIFIMSIEMHSSGQKIRISSA